MITPIAYHGRTAEYHQQQFEKLYPKGWRLTSISVYNYFKVGIITTPAKYAAVWVKKSGPSWAAIHNVDAKKYQTFFNKYTKRGFHPILLSVAGTKDSQIFAGTMEKRPGPIPLTRYNLKIGKTTDSNTIGYWNKKAYEKNKNWVLTNGSIYGAGADLRFAGIWSANKENVSWNADGYDDDAKKYQQRFNAQMEFMARPSFVTASAEHKYLSIFRGDQIGSWKARHGMTPAAYQKFYEASAKQGYYPISVQGSGVNKNKYSAIFAKSELVVERKFTVRGGSKIASLDDLVRQLMEIKNIRGLSAALVKGTKLIWTRGYTYAEPGFPITTPNTTFRIASVSKTVVALAIYQLIEKGKLTLDTTMQSVLKLKTQFGKDPVDSRFNKITIKHLLEHTSGLSANKFWQDKAILKAYNSLDDGKTYNYPVTNEMSEKYMAFLPLEFEPGDLDRFKKITNKTQLDSYCNCGYWFLGRIVAKIYKKSTFVDAIKDPILKPLHIKDIYPAKDLLKDQRKSDTRYRDIKLRTGHSVMGETKLVAYGYGEAHIEKTGASGGLTTSVVAMARLVAALNDKLSNPILPKASINNMLLSGSQISMLGIKRAGHGFDQVWQKNMAKGWYDAQKGGSLASSGNFIGYKSEDISVILNINSNSGTGWYPWAKPLVNAANKLTWTKDLFPEYGMPALALEFKKLIAVNATKTSKVSKIVTKKFRKKK